MFSGLNFVSENVSATSNNTWKPTSGALASTAANWENSTLVTGQNLYFISAYTGSCTFDVSDSFGTFIIKTGYTGTITQSASFSVTYFLISAGTFTGSPTYMLTDSGNFIQTGGGITQALTFLNMTGDSNILTLKQMAGEQNFHTLNLYGNITLTQQTINTIYANYPNSGYPYPVYELSVAKNITISVGKTITISSGSFLRFSLYGMFPNGLTKPSVWINNGIITGSGSVLFLAYDTTAKTMSFGTINCPVYLVNYQSALTSYIITASSNSIFGSTLIIAGAQANGRTMTLDLSASNYSLTTNGIIVGKYGILKGRTSTISSSGNFQSDWGSYLPESSSLYLTGTTKTLKTGTERITNLFLNSGSSYTMQSNIYSINYWGNGTLTKAGYTLYINNDQTPSFTYSPSISCYTGINYSYNAQAPDREYSMSYSISSNLTGISINTTTGLVSKINAHKYGSYYINILGNDTNHTIYQNYTLSIIWAVIITSTPINSINSSQYYQYYPASNITGIWIITTNATWLNWNPVLNTLYGQSPTIISNNSYWINITVSTSNGIYWQNYTLTIVSPPEETNIMLFIMVICFLILLLAVVLIFVMKE